MKKYWYIGGAILLLIIIAQCGGNEENEDSNKMEMNIKIPDYFYTQTLKWNADWSNATWLRSLKFNKDSTFTMVMNLPRNSGCTEEVNTGKWKIISRYNKETEKNTSYKWQKAIKENSGEYRFENEDDDSWIENKVYMVSLVFDNQGNSEYFNWLKEIMMEDSLVSENKWNIKNGWAFDCYRGMNQYRKPTILKASNKYPLLLSISKKSKSNKVAKIEYVISATVYSTSWRSTGKNIGNIDVRNWEPNFWTVSNSN